MKEDIINYIREKLADSSLNQIKLIKHELKTIGGKFVTDGFRIGYLVGAVVAYDRQCYYVLLNKERKVIFISCEQEISVIEDINQLQGFSKLIQMLEENPLNLKERISEDMSDSADIFFTPLYIGKEKMFLPQQTILSADGKEQAARLEELAKKEDSIRVQEQMRERREKREFINKEKEKIMETRTTFIDESSIIDPTRQPIKDAKLDWPEIKYIHLLADFENYKKRTQKEKDELKKSANESILKGIIELVDDMERGLKYSNDDGLSMIYNKFQKFLLDNGVEEIKTDGELYNCDLHEAVGIVECGQNGHIIQTTEKGYFLNGKVLRYAKVIVGN